MLAGMDTRAAFVTELGPPENIQVGRLDVPAIGATDVLVRTEAVEVNYVDLLVRSGRFPTPTPFPFVVGRDLVGVVAAADPGATGFAEGTRVWCNSLGHGGRQGSFAEDVVVPADRLYRLPDGVEADEAVSVLHGAGTAYLGLFREARVGPADTIVVGGAGGAVGGAAAQLAEAAGARVLATASADDADWCRASGAQEVFDYHDPELIDRLHDAAPDGVDAYWDTSGHQDLSAIAPLLRVGARVVVTAAAAPTPPLPAAQYYTRDVGVHGFAISNASVSELADAARMINARLADGTVSGRIGARMSLTDAAAAHRMLEAGEVRRGRIVLTPSGRPRSAR
jgi:NADPH:quinone reductase-like Zn-dependent oxidoreductase